MTIQEEFAADLDRAIRTLYERMNTVTIHVFPCNPDKGGCGFEIPVEPKTTEQKILCPRCGKLFKRIFLGVGVKGVEVEVE